MKLAAFLFLAAFVSGCSRPSPDHADQPVVDNAAIAQARTAVTETEAAVLAARVHALEVEVAQMRNAPQVANMQLLEDRMKTLELKVYGQPGPDGSAAAPMPAVGAAPIRKSPQTSIKTRDSVNPFPSFRRLTQAERDAVDRLPR